MKKNILIKKALIIVTITLLVLSIFNTSYAISNSKSEGFEKGISWQPYMPMKKATLVNFDKDTLIDDYAYLASVPTSIFSDGETIYANPLLLFQPDNTYPDEEKYRFLNDYSGTHYLMEDWMSYCDGKMDKLTTINVDQSELEKDWKAKTTKQIQENDPYKIASEITLDEWSYSDEAVIAVIEENYEKPQDSKITGVIEGEISGEVEYEHMTIDRPFGPASQYGYFDIDDEYKYVRVDLWYPAYVYHSKILGAVPGFNDMITIPSVDPDLQIFCKYEGDWIQTAAQANMAITNGPHEKCFSYVYEPGEWRVGVTNMPTEGGYMDDKVISDGIFGRGKIERYGSRLEVLKSLLFGIDDFNIEVTKYPGVEEIIPDVPSFGCRNADFILSWDDEETNLGLTVIGPLGEEIVSVLDEDADEQNIHLDMVGECLEGINYRVVVYALDDISRPIDYTLEYRWQQNITRKEGDLIASACEGAVLGSVTNNPLLYISPEMVPDVTKDTLLKLGIEKINVVDIGGYLTEDALNSLSNIAEIRTHYTSYEEIYEGITKISGSNDIVFSTIDPWSYWYYYSGAWNLEPDGKYDGAFYFGPATYAAAIHGTPLILVDNHPELSGAVTWHHEFWRNEALGATTPPTMCMYLTGRKVYDFLDEIGFDEKGSESILTVAGQYNIGPTWTRAFAGVANPGGIIGTPVDTTNHIVRCMFYPGLIFENPAMQGEVELETGSESVRSFLVDGNPFNIFEKLRTRLSKSSPGLSNLKITSPSHVEKYIYPVLHTFGAYCHRVNERGSKYWGVKYVTRRGYTPGFDLSGLEIDMGTREIYEGKKGSFLPDLSPTVYTPFYAEKAGYSNAYSNNFDITMDNLNQGVISWYMVNHGDSSEGGWLSWWEPPSEMIVNQAGLSPTIGKLADTGISAIFGTGPYADTNPWRGYDMWWGSTEEPDSAVLNSKIGLIPGWTNAIRIRDLLDKGFFKIGLDIVPAHLSGYHDGQVGPYSLTGMIMKFHYSHPATEIDDKLENLHSMNFHAGSCLIGCNYLQIAFLRHGSVLQEMDPWPTSYWAGYSFQQIPKDFALGKTVGESYSHGITEIGPQYVFKDDEDPMWWWDDAENVVLFADPNLRIWIPSTEYDDQSRNHWEKGDVRDLRYDPKLDIDGHMPFGADSYPNEKQPTGFFEKYMIVIIVLVLIVLLILSIAVAGRKKR